MRRTHGSLPRIALRFARRRVYIRSMVTNHGVLATGFCAPFLPVTLADVNHRKYRRCEEHASRWKGERQYNRRQTEAQIGTLAVRFMM
jgi:hypothetical protein